MMKLKLTPRVSPNDRLVLDEVSRVIAMESPLPPYITPAQIAGMTGLPMQTVGLTIGRLFRVSKIRNKGYSTQALIDGYRAWQERNHDHAG